MTRILRVITRLNLGGPARGAINLATGLEREGFETLTVAGMPEPGEGDLSGALRDAGGRLEILPALRRGIRPLRDLAALAALRRIVRAFRPHIVHTHTSKAGLIGRLAAGTLRPAPIRVHTFHGHVLAGYFGPVRSSLFRALERRLARSTDALIAVSPSVMEELLGRFHVGAAAKYRVIPSGLPELHLASAAPLREELGLGEAVVAGFLGRLVPIKGIREFLDALPRVLRAVPDLKVLIAGDGPLRRSVERLASRPPWKGAVRLLGLREDRERVLKTLDFLVLPSRQEGLPTVLLEAALAGVPAAAARIPSVADLFTHGKDALLFDVRDPEDLAGAVVGMAGDAELRRRLAERAAEAVRSRVPDYAEVVRLHAELYRSLLARRAT